VLDFLKRSQLIKRGLASRKTRRRRSKNDLLHSLEYAAATKYFIFAAFVAGLAAVIFSGQQPEPTKNFVISLLFFATALTQLWINQPTTFLRSSRLLLVFGIIFIQLAATKFLLMLCNSGSFSFLRPETVGLIAPYAARRLTKGHPGRALAPAAVIGAILLLVADLAVRFGPAGRTIPVGVLTTVVGAPLFIWIVVTMRRRVAS